MTVAISFEAEPRKLLEGVRQAAQVLRKVTSRDANSTRLPAALVETTLAELNGAQEQRIVWHASVPLQVVPVCTQRVGRGVF